MSDIAHSPGPQCRRSPTSVPILLAHLRTIFQICSPFPYPHPSAPHHLQFRWLCCFEHFLGSNPPLSRRPNCVFSLSNAISSAATPPVITCAPAATRTVPSRVRPHQRRPQIPPSPPWALPPPHQYHRLRLVERARKTPTEQALLPSHLPRQR